jgi:hypothetical protein
MPAASDVRCSGRDQGISRLEAVDAGRPLLTQNGHGYLSVARLSLGLIAQWGRIYLRRLLNCRQDVSEFGSDGTAT